MPASWCINGTEWYCSLHTKFTVHDPHLAEIASLREKLAAASVERDDMAKAGVLALAKIGEQMKRAETAEALVAEFVAVARAADRAYEAEHGGYDALASHEQECLRELLAGLSPAARKEMAPESSGNPGEVKPCAACGGSGFVRTLGGHNEEVVDYCQSCAKEPR